MSCESSFTSVSFISCHKHRSWQYCPYSVLAAEGRYVSAEASGKEGWVSQDHPALSDFTVVKATGDNEALVYNFSISDLLLLKVLFRKGWVLNTTVVIRTQRKIGRPPLLIASRLVSARVGMGCLRALRLRRNNKHHKVAYRVGVS